MLTGAIGAGPIAAGPLETQIGGANTLGGAAISLASASAALSTGLRLGGNVATDDTVTAQLTNWAQVTLVGTLYTGFGGILSPGFWMDSAPHAGSTLYYDGTYITILPDGEIISTNNNCSAVVQFYDGTAWALGIVVITPTMVANASAISVVTAALTATDHLVGAAGVLVQVAGALTTHIPLAGQAASVTQAAAALNTAIRLAGAAVSPSSVAASLNAVALASTPGDTPITSVSTGVLSTAIRAAAAATAIVQAAGNLATKIQLAANAVVAASAAAALRTDTRLSGDAISASVANGALVTQIKLAAPATDLITAAGALSTAIKLLGAGVSSSSAVGQLITRLNLAAAPATIAAANASLSTMVSMQGVAWAASSARGTLVPIGSPFAGGPVATSTATGDLLAPGSPIGLYVYDPFFVTVGVREDFTYTFEKIAPGEAHVLTFDYSVAPDADQSSVLVGGELLEGIIHTTVLCTSGIDLNPQALLNGPPAYDPTRKKVMQPIIGPPAGSGNTYYLTVLAPTTNPQKILNRFGLLPVLA